MDIWLEDALPLADIETALNGSLPPGMQICSVDTVSDRDPTLQTQLLAAEYLITLLEPLPELETRLQAICRSDSLPRQRRGKAYDLRPLLLELRQFADDEDGQQRLLAVLAAQEGATGRPEEVILALGGDPTLARVHRTRLVFISPS